MAVTKDKIDAVAMVTTIVMDANGETKPTPRIITHTVERVIEMFHFDCPADKDNAVDGAITKVVKACCS